jgi:hypothetical protein
MLRPPRSASMTNQRRSYSQSEEVALVSQVNAACPLCGAKLFYTKKAATFKVYELAHIYPLNPTPEEVDELKEATQLHADVNHPDNIIPLCRPCHTKYDKPRTREEYTTLADIKRQLLARDAQKMLIVAYPLDVEIQRIITGLHNIDPSADVATDLEYNPKNINLKFDDSVPSLTRQKIKHAVSDYYQHIKQAFLELERDTPAASELIFAQVRAYYLKQKSLGLTKRAIFGNVVEWIRVTTRSDAVEAAEVVASFFVQNCEVFE